MSVRTIQLAQDVHTRDSSVSKDSKTLNGYVEIVNKDRAIVVKRNGYTSYQSMPVAAAPQMFLNYYGSLVVAMNSTLYVGQSSFALGDSEICDYTCGGWNEYTNTGNTFGPYWNSTTAPATIVGQSTSGAYNIAFKWTSAGGMVALASYPSYPTSRAMGISGDGQVIVGSVQQYPTTSLAVKWNADNTITLLGALEPYSEAIAASNDGSVIVGISGTRAFRWTAATGMVDLCAGTAYGVSADGTVIVGSTGTQPFRWTAATGVVTLSSPLSDNARAYGISKNGLYITGAAQYSGGGTYTHLIKWTSPTAYTDLGQVAGALPNTGYLNHTFGISNDGWTIGYHAWGAGWTSACRWTPSSGLAQIVTDFTLSCRAHAVTDNGGIIVGMGNVGGYIQAFYYTVAGGIVGIGRLTALGYSIAYGISGRVI